MSDLSTALREADDGMFDVFEDVGDWRRELRDLWEPDVLILSMASQARLPQDAPRAEWTLAFTPTFRKSVGDIDKKMQGRVLAAISELSESPTVARGDTIKPLVGERKGLWRYRLGDFRLVYEPRDVDHLVLLLEFGARGGIYEQ